MAAVRRGDVDRDRERIASKVETMGTTSLRLAALAVVVLLSFHVVTRVWSSQTPIALVDAAHVASARGEDIASMRRGAADGVSLLRFPAPAPPSGAAGRPVSSPSLVPDQQRGAVRRPVGDAAPVAAVLPPVTPPRLKHVVLFTTLLPAPDGSELVRIP